MIKYIKKYGLITMFYLCLAAAIIILDNYMGTAWALATVGALFIGIGLIQLLMNWGLVIGTMRNIESMIWGKPLDKEHWEGQRLPKVKLRWGKDKEAKP